jgi:hypothetical protein
VAGGEPSRNARNQRAHNFNLSRIGEPIFGAKTVTIIVTITGKIPIHGDTATGAESAT